MKAIIEIEAPRSCSVCPFCIFVCPTRYCIVGRCRSIDDHTVSRAPDCPLKIVEEEKNEICADCRYSDAREAGGFFCRLLCRGPVNNPECRYWYPKDEGLKDD